MQSGITVSAELQNAFSHFSNDSSSFCLPITITSESLTPLTPLLFTESNSSPESFFSSLPQLSSVLQPKTPIFLLLRRPTNASFSLIALTYIPSDAPVRPKMLFASTRSTLFRELGAEKFASTVFATEEAGILERDAWRERDGEINQIRREDLMGEKERELEKVRMAEAEARSGPSQRDIGIGGTYGPGSGSGMKISMPVDEAAKTALKELQEGGLVQLTVDIPTETITLADSKSGVDAGDVASHISSTSPRYSFYHYPGSDAVVFVYTCPTGSSIKERMLHASSRRNAIAIAEQEGLQNLKKIEASSPDEITGERLQEEVEPPQNQGAGRGFARPRRPGR
ncbi:hypothetical protein N7495_006426 [Penicillium taxi]|uniref:uncharacterized protein n=1 Tax=Penicillium taxi TaxID=168475 RepID=UPI002545A116|nr:uncharacterized protein N7495_006426 [Penicillium taxi]KAJ5894735.1 hypothetical protein N7495_006426 [Penicillium taxi]